MRLTYHNLVITLPVEDIQAVASVEIEQRLNEHARAVIKVMVEEEKALKAVEQADGGLSVSICNDSGQTLFCGRGEEINARKEGGLYYLYLTFCGYTKEWDLTDKSQSFCKSNDTYEQVFYKVLSEYPEKEIRDEITCGAKIPEMLLQYEESDWAFLKRLASHFSTFLLTDDTGKMGKVYFGIPHMDKGAVLTDEQYTLIRGKERYDGMEKAEDILPQEMTGWRIRTKRQLCFGEQVMLNHIETVVTAVDIHTVQGDLIWEYELSRRAGIISAVIKNDRIYGMSIPATVKERKGNQIRVHFDIDPVYEPSDDLKYFTYAIETSNFYCMPEEESRVHIYFPSHDERDAMAVHALSAGSVPGGPAGGFSTAAQTGSFSGSGGDDDTVHTSGGGSSSGDRTSSGGDGMPGGATSSGEDNSYAGGGASAAVPAASVAAAAAVPDKKEEKKQAPKIPAYKKFSDPSGSYLELAPYGITLSPSKSAAIVMDAAAGILALTCNKVDFASGTVIFAGSGDKGPIPEITAIAKNSINIALSGKESSIKINKDTDIFSTFIKKDAELKKAAAPLASYVEKKLTESDGDLRDCYNANAVYTLAALAEKKKEGERKVREGIWSVITVVAVVGLTVATGGAAAPLLIVGGAKAIEGLSDIAEGASDIYKAEHGDLSRSFNLVRDTICLGNEEAYQALKGVTDFAFDIVAGGNMAKNLANVKNTQKVTQLCRNFGNLCDKSKAANYISNIGGDMFMNAVNEYVETGSVTLENTLSATASGFLKGFGMNHVQFSPDVIDNKYLRKAINIFNGTVAGMTVDYGESKLKDEEYHPFQSFIQNVCQAGLGQLFGEPIDAVSGAFLITVHEFILPDIITPIYLTRRYFSTDKKAGWLGQGWHISYEGRLCHDGDVVHVTLPDGFHAAYTRTGTEDAQGDIVYKDILGSGKYRLSYDAISETWHVTDTHDFRTYRYNAEGFLTAVTDKNGCSTLITYRNEFPDKLTTPLGYEIFFTFESGRLTKLSDSAGRSIEYHYENNLLAEVVHMDGGISRYLYTEEGYLTQAIDQTGESSLINEYDEKGRVVLQTLANGDTYKASYDERKRETAMEYSAYPGVTIYHYNEEMLITKVTHPDNTEEAFAYDTRRNRIMEKGRNGGATYKTYDECGRLIQEILPEGLEREYYYDKCGNLTQICDSGGRERLLTYDECHNLTSRKEKKTEGEWSKETFTWDVMGRLTEKEDAEGHRTRYHYEKMSAYPYRTVYADGTELLCEYDALGRKLSEEDATGRTEYAYNRNGWQTMERDGEGNETHRLYDGSGRLTASYSPKQWIKGDGKRTQYRYDFLNRLTETIYADESHEKQFRDGEGNIIKKVHPSAYDIQTGDGEGTRYDYDKENRLLRIRYPDGGVERFFYDGAGNRIKHILPEQYDWKTDDGKGYTYTYDKENRLTSVTGPDGVREASYTYDPWGNCVQMTDEKGCDTYYAYDLAGRIIRKLEPVGDINDDTVSITYRMTTYVYDNNGNRVKEIRHGGVYTQDGSIQEPGDDLILTYTYDARNRLVCVEDGQGARASYRYDEKGRRTNEEQLIKAGENGEKPVYRKIKYRYDKRGKLIEKRELLDDGLAKDREKKAETEPETAVTRYSYDENGNLTGIITPEGYRIARQYDCRDRLIMEQAEDKINGIALKTLYTYDSAGNTTSVRQEAEDGEIREINYGYDLKDRLTSIQETDGRNAYLLYDKNDRRIREKHLLPKEEEDYSQTMLCYDIRGRLTAKYQNEINTERNIYSTKGSLLHTRDGDGVEISCRYGIQDEQRQIYTVNSRRQGRAAQSLSYNARGMITETEDGCGSITKYTHDAWGRITSIETPDGGLENYAYDSAGNVTESIDAGGGAIRYDYDSRENICKITDQSGLSETFRYDKEGRQTRHTDRNGTVTETKYNIYNKPVIRTCTDKAGNRRIMGTWDYDSFGNLTKAVAGGFAYTYEHTPDGRLLNKYSSGKKVLSCTYYRNGSLKSMADASGKTLFYEYNNEGRLKALKDDNDEILTSYRYTMGGRIKEIITKGGIKTTYEYDDDGNISRLMTGDGTKKGRLYDAFMLYDLNGSRTEKRGIRQNTAGECIRESISYRYDYRSRLIKEEETGKGRSRVHDTVSGNRYTYDLNGNRLTKECYHNDSVDEAESYQYNERNELKKRTVTGQTEAGAPAVSATTLYHYDNNGSLISEEQNGRTSEYRYDLLNRQTYVKTLDGKIQENSYDGENMRAGLTEDGKRSIFLYHNGELLTECDGESAPIKRYLNGIRLSHVQTLADGIYHTYHQDEHGSTAYITEENRQVQNSYRYDAFGNLTEKREEIENRILYTGQQYDQVTGQYYLRARYYNPAVGRFLQEDTYRGDGLNLYAYCANNPVRYYDPSGHMGCDGDTPPTDGTPAGGVNNRADFYVTPDGDIVPSTGYRYMSSSQALDAMDTGEQYVTYFGFNKYDSASQAQDAFQISTDWSDCKGRGTFDTLQVIDEMYVPTTFGNTTNIPEPFTESYPQYGKGGVQQFRVDKVVNFLEVEIIGD